MPRSSNHRPSRAGENLRLPLACLECGGRGLIPWKSLDGLFFCRACTVWFRLAETGRLVSAAPPPEAVRVQVRSATSDWQEDIAPLPKTRAPVRQRVREVGEAVRARVGLVGRPLLWLAACGVLALTMLLVTLLIRNMSRSAPAPRDEIPRTLEPRARLFAEAWVFQDSRRMMQLTDPAFDRALVVWLTRTPPPTWAKRLTDNPSISIETSIRQSDAHVAEVEARVWSVEGGRRSATGLLRQRWVEKDGSWYFLPPQVPGVAPVNPGGRPLDPDLSN